MPRVARIAGSFAIVTVVYWLYAWLAVPWIEPPADPQRDTKGIFVDGGDDLLKGQLKQLQGLFPPEAWEGLKKSILVNLGNDRAKLLFQRYDNSPQDGRLVITPCTIVIAPSEDGNEEERRRQPIILEAPEGAILRFDPPLDLGGAKMGRLVEGHLNGPVTIRSQGKRPGSEDDLSIVTRDVQLTQRTVATPNEVSFRWGPHRGRGRGMTIKLLVDDAGPDKGAVGPNITGLERLEMRHVDQLYLDLGPAMARPGQAAVSTPVEIHCAGPFAFDAIKRVATFSDRVEVLKSNSGGPADQILCDTLTIYFSPRSKGNASVTSAPGKPPGLLDLVAERVEATGDPVVVSAPSQSIRGRGQRLQYQLGDQSLRLADAHEVVLEQGANEIHARSLFYQPDPARRLGRVRASGPGWIRGQAPPSPGSPPGQPATAVPQQLEATWNGELTIEPQGSEQVIALHGGAQVTDRGFGWITAQEIFLWLAEDPRQERSGQPRLRPSRLQANQDVVINSAPLVGRVDELQVWFDQASKGQPPSGARMGLTPQSPTRPRSAEPQASPPAAASPPRQFSVVGRLLQVNLVLKDRQTSVSQLRIVDHVDVAETRTERPGERPLKIQGDRLEVNDADNLQSAIAITGRPARFEGPGGLGITAGQVNHGGQINLNRSANQLWIDGPGSMDLPLPPDRPEKPPAAPGTLTVDWQRGMDFDGRKASFQGSVVARAIKPQSDTELRTEIMYVHLQDPIRFGEPRLPQQPQVEQVVCPRRVTVQHRVFDLRHQLASNNHLEVSDAQINPLNGAMTAGPGCLNSVRRDTPDQPGNPSSDPIAAAIGGTPSAASPGRASNRLYGLRIQFQESLKGNLLSRELSFQDQVRVTYAPVASWDAVLDSEDPEVLGPDAILVHCDSLSVAQLLVPQLLDPFGSHWSVALAASGSVTVEGDAVDKGSRTHFTAQGSHLTYEEAKDLLILRGEGRAYARLSTQSQPGADRNVTDVQEIQYNRKTRHLNLVNVRSLLFNK